MASTNKTTNYELSQFIETDRPAWLTDYNGDMRTIDSTMKAISDVASGASGSISELADRMSTAEGNITTNTNDIAALDARADALEAGAQSQAGTIANIQTEQITQNAGIEAATELGYNLARPYDSASTYAVGDYVLFQNTLYKCVTAIATGEAFDPTKWLAIKATDEISAGGYTLPIASASQLGGFKVGNNLNIDPVTGVLSAGGTPVEWVEFYNENLFTLNSATMKINDTSKTLSNPTMGGVSFHGLKIGDCLIGRFGIRVNYASVSLSASRGDAFTVSANLSLNPSADHYGLFNSIDNLNYLSDSGKIFTDGANNAGVLIQGGNWEAYCNSIIRGTIGNANTFEIYPTIIATIE